MVVRAVFLLWQGLHKEHRFEESLFVASSSRWSTSVANRWTTGVFFAQCSQNGNSDRWASRKRRHAVLFVASVLSPLFTPNTERGRGRVGRNISLRFGIMYVLSHRVLIAVRLYHRCLQPEQIPHDFDAGRNGAFVHCHRLESVGLWLYHFSDLFRLRNLFFARYQ